MLPAIKVSINSKIIEHDQNVPITVLCSFKDSVSVKKQARYGEKRVIWYAADLVLSM